MKKLPDNLHQILDYSIVSGRFYWKIKPAVCVNVGDRAGAITRVDGYVQIQIGGSQYAAHRIAWKYCFGSDPKELIDHINHCESCNGLHNLREATHLENTRHRRRIASTGHTNIKQNGHGFGVRIGHKWFGTYPTIEEAISARDFHRQQQ
jgi:hypothetical protein